VSHARIGASHGIDYAGAQTSAASLKSLRVYMAEGGAPSAQVRPQFRCAGSTQILRGLEEEPTYH